MDQPAVHGIQIGGFNVLFESDESDQFIKSDVDATLDFLEEFRSIATEYETEEELAV